MLDYVSRLKPPAGTGGRTGLGKSGLPVIARKLHGGDEKGRRFLQEAGISDHGHLSPVKRRGIVYRVLTLIAVGLIATAFFLPGWWVALKAPNYPEATFPQGIKILFHMDSVRNGCEIRISEEVEEKEALDCVHEMDTINHYVGMYPIASGGPVEKAFSPYLFGMLGVMLLVFAAPGRKARHGRFRCSAMARLRAWMGARHVWPGGIKYQTTGYLEGLVDSLGTGHRRQVWTIPTSRPLSSNAEAIAGHQSAAKEKLEVAKSGSPAGADRQNLKCQLRNRPEQEACGRTAAMDRQRHAGLGMAL